MSTAHRPTWAPAKGGEEQGGTRIFKASIAFSAKNQAGHTKLKFRQIGQSTGSELKERDFRAELEEKEKQHFIEKKGISFEEERKEDLLLLEAANEVAAGKGAKQLQPRQLDADDEDDTDDESSSDSDDDDDEEALLLAELERIKKEREVDARKKAEEEAAREHKEKEKEFMKGNPLMSAAAAGEPTFAVKRRWDEDVVFKNQARSEPKQQKRFINDTIRSDFHRRFLERYVK